MVLRNSRYTGTCTQISSPLKKEKRFALNYFGFANMFYTSYRVKLCYDLIEIYFWVGVTQHLCTVSPAWVKEKSLYHHNLVHPQRIFDTELHVCNNLWAIAIWQFKEVYSPEITLLFLWNRHRENALASTTWLSKYLFFSELTQV